MKQNCFPMLSLCIGIVEFDNSCKKRLNFYRQRSNNLRSFLLARLKSSEQNRTIKFLFKTPFAQVCENRALNKNLIISNEQQNKNQILSTLIMDKIAIYTSILI